MAFVHVQGQPVYDENQIIASAKSQLTTLTQQGGELHEYFTKNNVLGEFVFDMTIQGKGDVITVFIVSSNGERIRENNLFKDKLYALKFSDIRIPKKQRVTHLKNLGR